MPAHPGNISKDDIYRQAVNDPKWQADNFVFQIVRRLVKVENKITRRHGMALWNLYLLHYDLPTDHALTPDKLFHNVWNVQAAYPALSESEALQMMDERGYVWVDPYFEGGEYFGQGYSDRFEPKGWNGK